MPLVFLLLSLLDGFLQPHFTFLKLKVLFSWPPRNTTLLFWSLPAFQDSTGNRGHARVNSSSASSTTSFIAAKRFSESGNALQSFSFCGPKWLSFALCSRATQGDTDSCRQIFCTQTCLFLALKTLTGLTWGLEVPLGTFDFVIGNGMFVPLLV